MHATVHRTDDIAGAALELFTESQLRAVRERGRFVAVLSGGSTPLPLYRALVHETGVRDGAGEPLPWGATHLLWGDERFVPHSHPDSNFGAAREALLRHLPIPHENLHPWPTGGSGAFGDSSGDSSGAPEGAPRVAEAYAGEIARLLRGEPFDLTLLGLGDDAHTASLFPGTGAVHAEGDTVVSRPVGAPHERLSLSAARLSRSRTVAFLVAGAGKREALRATLAGTNDLDRFPARAITALDRLLVITDQEIDP